MIGSPWFSGPSWSARAASKSVPSRTDARRASRRARRPRGRQARRVASRAWPIVHAGQILRPAVARTGPGSLTPAPDRKPRATRRRLACDRGAYEMRLASCARDFTSSFRNALPQVVLDRARADEQLSGDLSVGVSLRGEARDLRLLRRELVERCRRCVCGRARRSPATRPARARRTPPSRSRRRARGRPAAPCVRPGVGAHVAATRRTGGGHGRDRPRFEFDRAGRSPPRTGPRPPTFDQERLRARRDPEGPVRPARPSRSSTSRR